MHLSRSLHAFHGQPSQEEGAGQRDQRDNHGVDTVSTRGHIPGLQPGTQHQHQRQLDWLQNVCTEVRPHLSQSLGTDSIQSDGDPLLTIAPTSDRILTLRLLTILSAVKTFAIWGEMLS